MSDYVTVLENMQRDIFIEVVFRDFGLQQSPCKGEVPMYQCSWDVSSSSHMEWLIEGILVTREL
jgi:hypothetical protein